MYNFTLNRLVELSELYNLQVKISGFGSLSCHHLLSKVQQPLFRTIEEPILCIFHEQWIGATFNLLRLVDKTFDGIIHNIHKIIAVVELNSKYVDTREVRIQNSLTGSRRALKIALINSSWNFQRFRKFHNWIWYWQFLGAEKLFFRVNFLQGVHFAMEREHPVYIKFI